MDFIFRNMQKFSFRSATLFGGLSTVLLILPWIVVYAILSGTMADYNNAAADAFHEQMEDIRQRNLVDIAEYIEEKYPELRDVERFKQEAGTDWFWNMSDEWRTMAQIFGLAYIYYIEKTEAGYKFLMSAGMKEGHRRDWLNSFVWAGPTPAFIDKAYETKQLAFSSQITINEWGMLVSAAVPILRDGVVVGILGIDYSISHMASVHDKIQKLREGGKLLSRLLLIAFATGVSFVAVGLFLQLRFGYRFRWTSLKQMDIDERTHLMLDATPLACFFQNREGNMLDCNKETLRLFGFSHKREFLDNYHGLNPEYQPDGMPTADKLAKMTAAAFETGYQRYEWLYLTRTGEPLPVEATLVRIPWKDDHCLAVYSRDLREIKAQERLTRLAEEAGRLMLNSAPFSCVIWNRSMKCLDCNAEALRLLEFSSKEDYDHIWEKVPKNQPDGADTMGLLHKMRAAAFEKGRQTFEWVYLLRDGEPRYVETTYVRIPWADGFRLAAYSRDLTEIKKSEQLTRESEEYSQMMLEGVPLACNLFNEDCQVLDCNSEALRMYNLQNKREYVDMFFTRLSPLLQPDGRSSREKSLEMLRKAFESGREAFEWVHIRSDGGEIPANVILVRLKWRNSYRVAGYVRDLTEEKAHMAEMNKAHEQLKAALVKAEENARAKSDFLSNMSHEIRTPINAITGMASIGRTASSTERKDYAFGKIKDASTHLLGIINDILNMAKLEDGWFELAPVEFSFDKMLRKAVDIITFSADEKGLTLRVAVDGNIPERLVGDDQRLAQAILNFLSNAVKFTPGGGHVELDARLLEEENGLCTILIKVTDSGIGIPPERQADLFAPFQQADNSTTRKFGGTGLGLAITRKIVELMGGEIWVDSRSGGGASFTFTVKVERAGAQSQGNTASDVKLDSATKRAGDLPEEAEGAPPGEDGAYSGYRVLLAEDVEINSEIVLALLEPTGLHIDCAENGKEAVRIFQENPERYDMIFMDLQMPEMDGLEATRRIRALGTPKAGSIPIIAMTTDVFKEDVENCLAAGMNAHVGKPLDLDDILEQLRVHLRPH
ncbi:MAG: PAS domain-containing protein [Desulfovibrio sp.]|jgi:signal transduction histidine kinase/CheY-like chemotaxis protein|nr:PAS domain-containing protein [Desulfovibrio sp.]